MAEQVPDEHPGGGVVLDGIGLTHEAARATGSQRGRDGVDGALSDDLPEGPGQLEQARGLRRHDPDEADVVGPRRAECIIYTDEKFQ